ncbi:glycosyltransferase [Pedobacter petrophilus]|uniref:Glycosyltransferase n=1 Tax=Pedobacter petrophilus TaxID=1908241 RepID=A0A7K0FW17_9SPHI|nr:glycosyltransferase family 2 protein [Pedobacter petrophilus]MRX75621.1 glycosyltransferase [Pedobacter petrophilus]
MQKVNTFISIIIPTYNSALTISKCINSILTQSFANFEIIIQDGISKDKTLDIIANFKDKRIITYSEADHGIYDAMNKGIDKANGKWFYFLGSDDQLYNNDVFRKIYEITKITKEKVIYGNALIMGNAGWAKNRQIYDGEFNLKKILKRNICHQAIFYNHSLFKEIRFNQQYHVCGDYDLNLKLFSQHRFKFIDFIIAIFNGGGTSVVAKDNHFNLANCIIDYFYLKLYKSEFSHLKNVIRSKAITSSKLSAKVYLNAVYLKHKICTNAD